MFSPAQLRAARALLDWTRADLAEKAGVSVLTIQTFEQGVSDPRQSTLISIRAAIAKAGVIFFEDADVREHGPGVAFSASQKRKVK